MRITSVIVPFALFAGACGSPDAGLRESSLTGRENTQRLGVSPAAGVRTVTGFDPAAATPALHVDPHFMVLASLNTYAQNGVHVSEVTVTVQDETDKPVANVEVLGSYTGSIEKDVVLRTGADGTASFTATGPQQHISVGFTVNGVNYMDGNQKVAGVVLSDVLVQRPCCQGKTQPQQ